MNSRDNRFLSRNHRGQGEVTQCFSRAKRRELSTSKAMLQGWWRNKTLLGERKKRKELLTSMKGSEVTQSCPTLCDPTDYSLPGSIHGFSRQEYWSGLPFPSLGIFQTQGSNPGLQHCRQTLYPLSHYSIISWTILISLSALLLFISLLHFFFWDTSLFHLFL